MASQLPTLLHQYAALHPVLHLALPPSSPDANLALARQQPALVAHLLQHPTLARYPPAEDYRRGFWKTLVARLEEGCSLGAEEEELEVHQDIYDAYLSTIQLGGGGASASDASPFAATAPPSASFKTFFFPPPSPSSSRAPSPPAPADYSLSVTLREEQKTIQAGTTGLRTWGASLRLAELFLAQPQLLPPSGRVLELGSGVGFLGLCVAKMLERQGTRSGVVMTDFDERVLAALHENVEINGFKDAEVGVQSLNWEDSLPGADGAPQPQPDALPQADLIIAADVVYDPSIIPPLIATLVLLLSSPSPSPAPSAPAAGAPKSALIASTIRNASTFAAFLHEAAAKGLRAEELPAGRDAPRVFWGAEEGGPGALEVRVVRFTLP